MKIANHHPFEDDAEDHSEETDQDDLDLADDEAGEGTMGLDALEAEELATVETNESATMIVDEASEIVAIRREEMTLDAEAEIRKVDEFVCRSCFLLLKNVQLADRDGMLCVDCV